MLAVSTIIGVVIVEVDSPGPTVVMGDAGFMGPDGRGWGQQQPTILYNGGDASGTIFGIRWSSWGGAVAVGRGANPLLKLAGGYYGRPAVVELRASEIRRCTPNGPLAYSRLITREQDKPGGPFGPWGIDQPDMCVNCDPVETRAFTSGLHSGRVLLASVATDSRQRVNC